MFLLWRWFQDQQCEEERVCVCERERECVSQREREREREEASAHDTKYGQIVSTIGT